MRPGLGELGIVQQNREEVLLARRKKEEALKLQSSFSITARNFLSAKVVENGLDWVFNDSQIDPFDCDTKRFFNSHASQILRAHQSSSNDDKNRFFVSTAETDPQRVLVSKYCVVDGGSKGSYNFEFIADWVKPAEKSAEQTSKLQADPEEFTEAINEACTSLGLKMRATRDATSSGLCLDLTSFKVSNVDGLFADSKDVRKKAMSNVAMGLSSAILMKQGYLQRNSISADSGVFVPGPSDDVLMCAMLAREMGSNLGWGINTELRETVLKSDSTLSTEKSKAAVDKIAMTYLHTSLCSISAMELVEKNALRFSRRVSSFSEKLLSIHERLHVSEAVNSDGSSVLIGSGSFDRSPAYKAALRVEVPIGPKLQSKDTLAP